MKRDAFTRHFTLQTTPLHRILLKTYFFFQQNNQCKISDDERKLCEDFLMAAECLGSLKTMEPNKTPGTDGIPLNSIKSFGMTSSPFPSPLLTPPMRNASFLYHNGED